MNEQKLVTWTNIQFDLFDRLRILFGAKVQVKVVVTVPQEQEIKMYNASSEVEVEHKTFFTGGQDKPGYGLVCKG